MIKGYLLLAHSYIPREFKMAMLHSEILERPFSKTFYTFATKTCHCQSEGVVLLLIYYKLVIVCFAWMLFLFLSILIVVP